MVDGDLASRPRRSCNLGRENSSFRSNGRTVASPLPGRARRRPFEAPDLESFDAGSADQRDDFDAKVLDPEWISLRHPASDFASLDERPGWLRLSASAATLRDTGYVSYLGRRQRHMSFVARTVMEYAPSAPRRGGLALVQSETHQYRLELGSPRRWSRTATVCAEGGPIGSSRDAPITESSIRSRSAPKGRN
jgi:alpha-N-arabinofuranosidase